MQWESWANERGMAISFYALLSCGLKKKVKDTNEKIIKKIIRNKKTKFKKKIN